VLLLLCCVLAGAREAGAAELTLRTEDGLALAFTSEGVVEAVVFDDVRLPAPGGGVYVKDMSPQAETQRMDAYSRAYPGVLAKGGVEASSPREVRVTAALAAEALTVQASYRSEAGYIRVDVQVTNTADRERAVILYFRLPLDLTGARWCKNLQQGEPIDAQKRYLTPYYAHQGYRPCASESIFSAVTNIPVGQGQAGLSLVVPMDVPRWCRLTYEKQFGYEVEVELGLSPLTRKFPNQAGFSVLVYRVEPRWGLRSTVERYYRFFPDFFTRRIARGGTWYVDNPEAPLETKLAGPEDFSLRFKETYNWANVETRKHAVLAMKYVEPWCDHYVGTEEVMRQQAQELPANNLWAPTGKSQPIRVQAEALLISGVRAADGSLYGPNHPDFRNQKPTDLARMYGKNWPQVQQVLGPETTEAFGCRYPTNPDVELPGMCRGKSVMEYEVTNQWGRKPSSPQDVYDGIYYDSTAGWWTGWHLNNFTRDQFPYADFPLAFDQETGRVALLHGLSCIEFLRSLTERTHGEGKVTMANSGPDLFINFSAPYLDMLGAGEGFARGDYEGRWLLRSVAHTKPLSYLNAPGITEQDFQECLPFAVYPGGPQNVQDWERLRPLYRTYIPLLDRLDRAGWEPVPGAVSDNDGLLVERFGPGDSVPLGLLAPAAEVQPPSGPQPPHRVQSDPEGPGTLLLVVHNMTDKEVVGSVRLLDGELAKRVTGWAGPGEVRELISGRLLPVKSAEADARQPAGPEVAVRLSAKQSWVLEVRPPSPRPGARQPDAGARQVTGAAGTRSPTGGGSGVREE
jgi:hypothetical protein